MLIENRLPLLLAAGLTLSSILIGAGLLTTCGGKGPKQHQPDAVAVTSGEPGSVSEARTFSPPVESSGTTTVESPMASPSSQRRLRSWKDSPERRHPEYGEIPAAISPVSTAAHSVSSSTHPATGPTAANERSTPVEGARSSSLTGHTGHAGAATPQPRPSPRPSAQPSASPTPAPGDADSDKEAPALTGMAFDPSEVEAGQTVRIVVSVLEEMSGVRSISGLIANPSSTGTLPFGVGKDIGNGQFEGTITIPKAAEEGVWRVRQLSLEDNARNRRVTPYTTNSPALLTVRNPSGDSEPPQVIDAWVEQPSIAPGGTNRLVVEARDDKSEIASVAGAYSNSAGTARVSFNARGESPTRFVADIALPENADCGEWHLSQLVLRDLALNRNTVRDTRTNFPRATFFVSFGSTCDNEPPVLRSFGFDPRAVDNTGSHSIRILAMFEDQSGTASATGRIRGPRNADGKFPSIAFSLREENGVWTGTLQIPQHAANGLWIVDSLQIEDKAKNRKAYRSDDPNLAGAVIEVY